MEVRYRRIVVLACLCLLFSSLSITAVNAAEAKTGDGLEPSESTEQTQAPVFDVTDQTVTPESELPGTTVAPDIEELEHIPVTDIVVADYEDVLEVDSTLNISATVLPNTATEQTVRYSSSNIAVATVTQTGEVKGISAGKVTIILSCGEIEKRLDLTVKVSAKLIEVNRDYVLLKPGETFQLKATISPQDASDKTLAYSSGDSAIATISNNGLITAKSYGSTNIIIKNEDTLTAVSVIVNDNPSLETGVTEGTLERDEYQLEEHTTIDACPIVDSDMLQYLYTNKKDLYIEAADYVLKIRGELITNFNNEVRTDIRLERAQDSISFTLNGENGLCGMISVCISSADEYKYLYLYNATTGKYDLIKKDYLSEIDATTSGKYLLTKQPISSTNVSWWWIGVSALVVLLLLIVYVCLKKRYWFW